MLPGESLHVRVTVTADQGWRGGEAYESEIRIRGKYERAVCVRVQLEKAEEACCRIEMGESPTSVHADHWSRHFQCTELCFEPVAPPRDPEQPQPNPNTPR